MKKYKEKKIVKNTSSTLINYFLVIGYDDYNDNIPIKKTTRLFLQISPQLKAKTKL